VTSEEFAPIAGAAHDISPVTGTLTSHYTPRKSHRSLPAFNVSTEMLNARQCNMPSMARRQDYPVHLLLTHHEETDMTGYRILILIAAIVITGCEALVFVGTTVVN
jgi:hypothetical protein